MLKYHAVSDLGKARANNEDYFSIEGSLNLFILADGIGGHNYGEVAAAKACEVVKDKFLQVSKLSPFQDLETATSIMKFAIYSANKVIYQMALDDPQYKGMGTTLIVFFKFLDHIIIGHVGDSRCYYVDNKLELLTKDHTVFLNRAPKSLSLRKKHFLTKSVGLKEFVEPALSIFPFNPSAQYLICSDGLSDYISEEKIVSILNSDDCVETKSAYLLQATLNTEAKDNITFILIDSLFSKKMEKLLK